MARWVRGRMDRPVLVSPRRAVRRAKSTSAFLRPRASPDLQPVKARKRVAAGMIAAYSASIRRRCRWLSVQQSEARTFGQPEPFDSSDRVIGPHLMFDGLLTCQPLARPLAPPVDIRG